MEPFEINQILLRTYVCILGGNLLMLAIRCGVWWCPSFAAAAEPVLFMVDGVADVVASQLLSWLAVVVIDVGGGNLFGFCDFIFQYFLVIFLLFYF